MDIYITRKKSFTGGLVKYYCVVGMSREDFLRDVAEQEHPSLWRGNKFLSESSNVFQIAYKETVSIKIEKENTTMFVAAFMSSADVFSNEITIDISNPSQNYIIETKAGFAANRISIRKI